MTRTEWDDAWSYVREMWQQIVRGDLWHLLTPQQLLAASALFNRELAAISISHCKRVAI